MKRSLLGLVLLAWLVVTIYPLAWMAYTGFKTEEEVAQNVWAPPTRLRLQNFERAWREGAFRNAYLSSIAVSVTSGALSVALAALAGYAFARMSFRGKELLFYAVLLGMMIPVHVILIPLNRLLHWLDWRDTLLALIAPYVAFALPIGVFIMRGFFARVPRELEEAARIDGCSAWGVFWHVALPSARPALATVIVFNFVTMWNEFVFALTFLQGSRLATLPLALQRFSGGEGGPMMSRTCAAMTISVLPLLVVFFLAQKHIIRGLTAGALKQ